MSKRSRGLALGTLIAAGLGYVAGILTAPKSGRETRKDLADTAIKAKAETEKKLKKLHTELDDLIEQGKKKAGDIKEASKIEFNEALVDAKRARQKTKEILSALHKGDSDDKDLQKAVKEANKSIEHLKKYISKHGKTKKS